MLFVSITVLSGKGSVRFSAFVDASCLICMRGLKFDMGAIFITMTGILA